MGAEVEAPDWHRVVHLAGVDDTGDRQWVLLDGTGRIIAVIQGELEGITGNVNVDQTEKDREIQGADGATLRTVKVDASGQIIMVPRGQSGNYMLVDASGYLSTLIKGDDSGTPRTVAVDASGNIISVIKGNYSGSLKTLATDVDGNLRVVPYDPADVWGKTVGMGLAELASILTPCKRFDRRGNVIFWDSFENGLGAWISGSAGAGAKTELSADGAEVGAYCVKLTGGSDDERKAEIKRYFPYPASEKIGLEARLAWDANTESALVALVLYDGAFTQYAWVRWLAASQDFEYYDSTPAWQDIDPTAPLYEQEWCYQRIKVVADFGANEYMRAFLNNQEYDLTGTAHYNSAQVVDPMMLVHILVYSDAGQNAVCRVDNVILTENEPA